MKTILNPAQKDWSSILQRPTKTVDDIEATVNQVFGDVQKNGDTAANKYTQLFDGVTLANNLVSSSEIEEAKKLISSELKEAIITAQKNITAFHLAQKTTKVFVETTNGVECWQEKRPIQKVGLYIPGGTAPLFSTVLMLAIPAQIAGCKEIVLCSPPNKEGKIHPAILFAANLCGVTKIIKVGGIQAVAGLTFGTKAIPQVYKIFGPGNQFVTVAKQLATKYGVAIDMPAGPSELLVVADDSAKASYIASDLLSQAEHGADSQVILVSTSQKLIDEVAIEIENQLKELPRIEIAKKAIENSKSILMANDEIALALINEYGPEHFIVCTNNNNYYIDNIANAGSVFIGNYTPESAGDYASGTNHTLPTKKAARYTGGLWVGKFLKTCTYQKVLTDEASALVGEYCSRLCALEGFSGHGEQANIRVRRYGGRNIKPYASAE